MGELVTAVPDEAIVVALLMAAAVFVMTGRADGRVARFFPRARPAVTPAVEIADVADLLALVLASGRGVLPAMATVAERTGGRLGADLAVVDAARGWGLTDDQAWRMVDAAWQPVARALVLAEAAGVPPSTTLAAAAEDIRRAEDHRLEVATERLGVRLVLPLGLTFLPAFVATTVVPVVGALAATILAG